METREGLGEQDRRGWEPRQHVVSGQVFRKIPRER